MSQSSGVAAVTRGVDGAGGGIAAHGAAGVEKRAHEGAEMGVGHRPVDQQRLGRAADAGAPHLGVQHDVAGHGEVGAGMDVDVAIAVEMGEDRHARFRLHPGDEAFSPARHDDVDRAAEAGEHEPDRGAVAGRHERHGVCRQAGRSPAPRRWPRGSRARSGTSPIRHAG